MMSETKEMRLQNVRR